MTRPTRSRKKGFTLIELLVVISIIALLIAILLPALGIARRTAQRMENSARLRGIHQGAVTFGNSNKDWYPGINSKGRVIQNNVNNTGNSGNGDTVQARVWIMLNADLFTPEYIISPSETSTQVVEYIPPAGTATQAVVGNAAGGDANFSYAMLRFIGAGAVTNGGLGIAVTDSPRGAEWKATLNSQAVFMSDRNTGSGTSDTTVQSVHTERGEWGGGLVWGDGHAGYEQERFHETRYAGGSLNRSPNSDRHDDLFVDGNIGNNSAGPRGSNALMIARGNNVIFTSGGG